MVRAVSKWQSHWDRLSDKFFGAWYGWRHGYTLLTRCSLTGFFTRQFLELEGKQAIEKQARRPNSRALCIGYLDIDGFKGVNDALGHAVGDLVLRYIGYLWREMKRLGKQRGEDELFMAADLRDALPARVGGDEMVLFLRGATKGYGEFIIEYIRGQVKRMLIDPALHEMIRRQYPEVAGVSASDLARVLRKVDISSGIYAWVVGEGLTLEEAIGQADQLMYADKHRRRMLRQQNETVTSLN